MSPFIIPFYLNLKALSYEMKLMHLNQLHLSIPDISYTYNIRISSMKFAHICRDLSQFGDTVVITFTEKCRSLHQVQTIKFSIIVYIFGVGQCDSVKLACHFCVSCLFTGVMFSVDAHLCNGTQEWWWWSQREIREPVQAEFSCRHLNLFTKATPLSTQVQLSASVNTPSMIEYKLGIKNWRH